MCKGRGAGGEEVVAVVSLCLIILLIGCTILIDLIF